MRDLRLSRPKANLFSGNIWAQPASCAVTLGLSNTIEAKCAQPEIKHKPSLSTRSKVSSLSSSGGAILACAGHPKASAEINQRCSNEME
jgi:hypothetical protein